MASKNKNVINKNHSKLKQYGYTLGTCKLDFTLDLGIKSQLKDWVKLLETAKEEVEKDLAEINAAKS